MLAATLWLSLLPQTKQVDETTLEFYQQHFVIRRPNQVLRIPALSPKKDPKLSVMFRRGDNYAVWDDRGLTTRAGKWSFSTKLPDIPTSPKVASRDEILETADLMKKGIRKREAAGLSGSVRVGTNAYFLARWEERSGEPWLEALVSVDLTAKNPKPQFLARVEGLTLADRPIDDRLFILDGDIAAVLRTDRAWGIGRYSVKDKKLQFTEYGTGLQGLIPDGGTYGLYVEQTPYGTTILGRVNLKDGLRKVFAENSGPARFVDAEKPLLGVVRNVTGVALRNLETGAEIDIESGAAVKRAGKDILVYWPPESPKAAVVYAPARWEEQARWTAKEGS